MKVAAIAVVVLVLYVLAAVGVGRLLRDRTPPAPPNGNGQHRPNGAAA